MGTTPDYTARSGLVLMLCPNEATAWRNKLHHPYARVEVVGSPKVERWAALRSTDRIVSDLPTVGLAWHWESDLHPCARWAFPHWQRAIAELAAKSDEGRGYRFLGHGHPRAWPKLRAFYHRHGIESTSSATEVIQRADVVAFDSTSFGWEAAACGIPVVLMDAPWFQTGGQEFGLRFWQHADCGPRVRTGACGEFHESVTGLLAGDDFAAQRTRAIHQIYPITTGSVALCAEVIRQTLEGLGPP